MCMEYKTINKKTHSMTNCQNLTIYEYISNSNDEINGLSKQYMPMLHM